MAEYLRNLKQRDIAIAVIVLVALVAIAWWFLAYQPVRDKIAFTKEEIATLDADIIKGEQARDALPALRTAVAELEAAKNEFLRELPRTSEVANLLNQLTEAAEETKVIIASITQDTSQNSASLGIQDVRELSFVVNTLGAYEPTLDFMRSLEELSSGRFTKIDSIAFVVGDGTDEDIPLEIATTISPINPPLSTLYAFSIFVYIGEDIDTGGS